MINVDKLVTLDGKSSINVNNLVGYENGVIINASGKQLTFDENSGLDMVRLKGDVGIIIKGTELTDGKIFTILQEPDENPFIKMLITLTLQDGNDSSNSIFKISSKFSEEGFIELFPSSITNSVATFDSIDINTDRVFIKSDENVANVQIDLWTY